MCPVNSLSANAPSNMFYSAAGYLMMETITNESLLNAQDELGNYFEKGCHQIFYFPITPSFPKDFLKKSLYHGFLSQVSMAIVPF